MFFLLPFVSVRSCDFFWTKQVQTWTVKPQRAPTHILNRPSIEKTFRNVREQLQTPRKQLTNTDETVHKPEHACTYPKYTVNELQTYPKQVLNTAKTTPRQTPKISSRTLSMPQTNLKCKRILDWQTLQKPYRNHMWIKQIEDAACTMRKALQHHGAARNIHNKYTTLRTFEN